MKTILFVCTGNTCRSPIAQALLIDYMQQHSDDYPIKDYQVLSGGMQTQDGLSASDEAIMVLTFEQIDLRGHRSRGLDENLVRQADYILTMSVSQRDYLKKRFPDVNKIETIKQFAAGESGDIFDPYGSGIEAYRQCSIELKTLIPGIFARIFNTGGSHNAGNNR